MQSSIALNFHGIGRPGRALEAGEERYWIDSATFRAIIECVAGARGRGGDILVTFDDGNASDIEIAAPELARHGITASFFPLAGRLGAAGSLTAPDLRALRAAGHEIGSHGFDHVDWRRLDDEGRARELDRARAVLEDATGAAIRSAAVPFGRYDRRVLAALARRGYLTVLTSDGGRFRGAPRLVPRNSVGRDMTAAAVAAMLAAEESAVRRARRAAAMLAKRLR